MPNRNKAHDGGGGDGACRVLDNACSKSSHYAFVSSKPPTCLPQAIQGWSEAAITTVISGIVGTQGYACSSKTSRGCLLRHLLQVGKVAAATQASARKYKMMPERAHNTELRLAAHNQHRQQTGMSKVCNLCKDPD